LPTENFVFMRHLLQVFVVMKTKKEHFGKLQSYLIYVFFISYLSIWHDIPLHPDKIWVAVFNCFL
jgi:hypothetical protein